MICQHCGNEMTQQVTALNPLINLNGCAQPHTFTIIPSNLTASAPYPQVQALRDNTLCSAAYSPNPLFIRV
jgi:hypothetical protein